VIGEEEGVIGVEQWAEIRRLYFVEKRSKRAIGGGSGPGGALAAPVPQ
jgi:hypothetical protein